LCIAKTAGWIGIPFGLEMSGGSRNIVLDGVLVPCGAGIQCNYFGHFWPRTNNNGQKIEYEAWAVVRWREGCRVKYLLMRLNKWDLRQVLNVVREGEFLTVSGRLFQVSAEA